MVAIELLVSLFQSILNVHFILKFNGSRWKGNVYAYIALTAIFAAAIAKDHLLPGFGIAAFFISLGISIIFALAVCNKRYVKALISVCIYEATAKLISSLGYIVMSVFINDFESLIHSENSLGRFVYLAFSNLLLYVTVMLILHFASVKEYYSRKNGITAFLLSIITLVGLSAAMSLTGLDLQDDIQYQIIIITVTYVVVNIILYLFICRMEKQIENLQRSKYEVQQLNDKLAFEEERYNDAAAIWNNIRKVQHDIQHHLIVISGQLEDGNIEGCKQYVDELLPGVEHMGKLIRSDNPILDYLINSKLCDLNDTQVIISGSVGNLSDIKEIDLSCIIGNILDNAVEAINCAAEKRIELLFSMQNSNRIIVCRNTVAKSVLSGNRKLRSTKQDPGNHGYGHVIVEKIVEKYNGMVDYSEDGNMFEVQIVLPKQ